MNDLFLVYRDWDKGEFDIFGLPTLDEAIAFCEFNTDYELYESTLYALNEAKSIFERV